MGLSVRQLFQVHFHNGMSNTDKDFELCMRVENVILPKNGYFGVSAATGIGTNYYFHLFLPFVKLNWVLE